MEAGGTRENGRAEMEIAGGGQGGDRSGQNTRKHALSLFLSLSLCVCSAGELETRREQFWPWRRWKEPGARGSLERWPARGRARRSIARSLGVLGWRETCTGLDLTAIALSPSRQRFQSSLSLLSLSWRRVVYQIAVLVSGPVRGPRGFPLAPSLAVLARRHRRGPRGFSFPKLLLTALPVSVLSLSLARPPSLLSHH